MMSLARHITSSVKEGSSSVNLPDGVFYNPVQEFNRDLTVAVIKNYGKIHLREFIDKGMKNASLKGKVPERTTYDGLSILEALSASGLRSVRFSKEIPLVSRVTANDLDSKAVQLITKNVEMNKVEDLVVPTCSDAVSLMLSSRTFNNKFNVVDLDPYGSASSLLDSAVQCLYDGGLLCVTCTDMAVLCGSTPGTAYGKYGGVAIKMTAQHEQGLRILLHAVQQAASRHGRVIEPLLSLSVDFYARVFMRIRSSPSGVKRVPSRIALVYSCTGCQSFYLQRLASVSSQNKVSAEHGPPVPPICRECGGQFAVAGPLWADELHNIDFVNSIIEDLRLMKARRAGHGDNLESLSETNLIYYFEEFATPEWLHFSPKLKTSLPFTAYGTLDRLEGMLSVAAEELPDAPFYFQSDELCSTIRAPVPKIIELRSAFLNAGYRVSFSHAATASLKTDAPMSFIWDVICAWKRKYNEMKAKRKIDKSTLDLDASAKSNKKHPVNDLALRVEFALMARPLNNNVDFTLHPRANPVSRAEGLLRYQMNPAPNWGPKPRARPAKVVPVAFHENVSTATPLYVKRSREDF